MNKRQVGEKYEELAVNYLVERGYRILERNYRGSCGELDIIAEDDKILVYAEVKFRERGYCGDPLEAVDKRKKKRICRAALHHYAGHGAGEDRPCRFDVIGIYGDGRIVHIKNAFDYR